MYMHKPAQQSSVGRQSTALCQTHKPVLGAGHKPHFVFDTVPCIARSTEQLLCM